MLEARVTEKIVSYKGKILFKEEKFHLTETGTPYETLFDAPNWEDFSYRCLDWQGEKGFEIYPTHLGLKIHFNKALHWWLAPYMFAGDKGKSGFVFEIFERKVTPTAEQISTYENPTLMEQYLNERKRYYLLRTRV